MQLIVNNAFTVNYHSIKGKQVEIVDRKRSEIKWLVENRVIGEVRRWQFLFLPPFDFFYSDASEWLVTDRLARDLNQQLGCQLKHCMEV